VSIPQPPQPVKLIMSLLSADTWLIDEVCTELSSSYGPVDFVSELLPFRYTRYYEAELGADLSRRLVSFEHLIAPDTLPEIKNAANAMEAARAGENAQRRINIDPGYIALSHIILATCKGFSHRPYLRDGVYADLTLIFKAQSFQALEWTFPDYGSAQMIALLNTMRSSYLHQLRAMKSPAGPEPHE
jgi:hypothetical protein